MKIDNAADGRIQYNLAVLWRYYLSYALFMLVPAGIAAGIFAANGGVTWLINVATGRVVLPPVDMWESMDGAPIFFLFIAVVFGIFMSPGLLKMRLLLRRVRQLLDTATPQRMPVSFKYKVSYHRTECGDGAGVPYIKAYYLVIDSENPKCHRVYEILPPLGPLKKQLWAIDWAHRGWRRQYSTLIPCGEADVYQDDGGMVVAVTTLGLLIREKDLSTGE